MQTHERLLTYTVAFEPDLSGGFIAFVPLLPGCMSQGETFEQARINIKDAIEGYVSVLKEDGDEIPVESPERVSASISISSAM